MSPDHLLPIGATVRCGGFKGEITAAQWQPAHPSGVVPCHTVLLTHKIVRRGNSCKFEPLTKQRSINPSYVAIEFIVKALAA
jgi:hypothetical protein